MNDSEIENEIQAKGLTAPRLTPKDIEGTVVARDYYVFPGTCLTVCCLTLRNGFTVTGESACASPENFDPELGRKIAYENARNKVWQLEGYLLRERLHQGHPTHTPAYIAEVAHEVNRAYCESIGDDSQPGWADAPDWQKTSAINGVRFHINNPDVTPAESHENWLAEKVADGWVYGPEKIPEEKQHPCCVPYGELPVEQRTKDYLFKQVVRSLACR